MPGAVLEGLLGVRKKKKGVDKGIDIRWFILHEDKFEYFTSREEALSNPEDPKGRVQLEDVLAFSAQSDGFDMRLDAKKVLQLVELQQGEAQVWIDALEPRIGHAREVEVEELDLTHSRRLLIQKLFTRLQKQGPATKEGEQRIHSAELRYYAQLMGFEGGDDEWEEEFDAMSERFGWNATEGISVSQLAKLVDDEETRVTDEDLEELVEHFDGLPADPEAKPQEDHHAEEAALEGALRILQKGKREPRYFVLFQDRLQYWKTKQDRGTGANPKGVLQLAELTEVGTTGDLGISLSTPKWANPLILYAESQEEQRRWQEAIQGQRGAAMAGARQAAAGGADTEPVIKAAADESVHLQQDGFGVDKKAIKRNMVHEGAFLVKRGGQVSSQHFVLYGDSLEWYSSPAAHAQLQAPAGRIPVGSIEDVEVLDVGINLLLDNGETLELLGPTSSDLDGWVAAFKRVLDSTEGATTPATDSLPISTHPPTDSPTSTDILPLSQVATSPSAELPRTSSIPGLVSPLTEPKLEEGILHEGTLKFQLNGQLVARYCKLWRERLDGWVPSTVTSEEEKQPPDISIDLKDVLSVETLSTGFILNCGGHKTGAFVGEQGHLLGWVQAFLSILSAKQPSIPSQSSAATQQYYIGTPSASLPPKKPTAEGGVRKFRSRARPTSSSPRGQKQAAAKKIEPSHQSAKPRPARVLKQQKTLLPNQILLSPGHKTYKGLVFKTYAGGRGAEGLEQVKGAFQARDPSAPPPGSRAPPAEKITVGVDPSFVCGWKPGAPQAAGKITDAGRDASLGPQLESRRFASKRIGADKVNVASRLDSTGWARSAPSAATLDKFQPLSQRAGRGSPPGRGRSVERRGGGGQSPPLLVGQ